MKETLNCFKAVNEKWLTLTLILVFSNKFHGQIVFEKGYFINDSDQKIECIIKNVDWKNNPTSFEYKLGEDTSIQKASIENVKEFGIDNASKYVRATVQIDVSTDLLNDLSSIKNPDFKKEQLFLKVLIEGKASLFSYDNEGLIRRFFYTVDGSEISQLIYKRYLIDNELGHNNHFRQQLYLDLKCSNFSLKEFENISYKKKSLKDFFIEYNRCSGSEFISHEEAKQKERPFNLSFRPGLAFNSLAIGNPDSSLRNTNFGNRLSFRFGIEVEFIFSFNKRKWSLIAEPTYQSYEAEKQSKVNVSFPNGVLNSSVKYHSIEIPIGIRHYLYLNDKSKFFMNVSYTLDFPYDSSIKFWRDDGISFGRLEIKSIPNLVFGFGFKSADRYSIEMRYLYNRNVLNKNYGFWGSKYKGYSIIFGYSLFRNNRK